MGDCLNLASLSSLHDRLTDYRLGLGRVHSLVLDARCDRVIPYGKWCLIALRCTCEELQIHLVTGVTSDSFGNFGQPLIRPTSNSTLCGVTVKIKSLPKLPNWPK